MTETKTTELEPWIPAILLGEPHDTVRANLRYLRIKGRWSLRALEREMRLKEGHLRDLESGRKGATLELACTLARRFNLTLDALVNERLGPDPQQNPTTD